MKGVFANNEKGYRLNRIEFANYFTSICQKILPFVFLQTLPLKSPKQYLHMRGESPRTQDLVRPSVIVRGIEQAESISTENNF